MNLVLPYWGAVLAVVIGVCLLHGTSPFSMTGGSSYEWKVRRRLLAKILFVFAALCCVAGLIGSMSEWLYDPTHLMR